MKTKKWFTIMLFLFIFTTIIGFGYFFYTKVNSIRMSIEILNTEENDLRKEVVDWYKSKKSYDGIYVLSSTSNSDYLVYYNKNEGKNLYFTPRINTSLKNGSLFINVVDENAANDNYVNDRLLAHIKLENSPKTIEISVNGKKSDAKVETIDRIFEW